MEEKESYSPQEVAEIAKAYRKVCGGFDSPVTSKVIKEYEQVVPKNVRDVIGNLNNLETAALEDEVQKRLRERQRDRFYDGY